MTTKKLNRITLFLKLNFLIHLFGWSFSVISAFIENETKRAYWAISYAVDFSVTYWWVILIASLLPVLVVIKKEKGNGH